MKNPDIAVTQVANALTLWGVWTPSSDLGQARDIPVLTKDYLTALEKKPGEVLPFYVLSEGYDEKAGTFDLFIGGEIEGEGLEERVMPAGLYGMIVVRPVLGVFWGPALGRAKQFFYTKWLPGSRYEALGFEYERHTEESTGKKPSVELWFGIREKS